MWTGVNQETIEATSKAQRDTLLMQWQRAKEQLDKAKELELELRTQAMKICFDKPTEGVNTLDLGNNYKLKGTHKINYTLDSDNSKVEAMLDELEKAGNQGTFLAERLVSWKATLSVSEYKELPEQYKKIVDKVVTTKEGTPTLEIVEPKNKKK